MSDGLTYWVQRLLQRYVTTGDDGGGSGEDIESDVQENGIPSPPMLPSTRAHQLERAPDHTDIETATSTSGFFQNLPPDVRRMILVEAFGDRIMHIDLQYRRLWRNGPDLNVLPMMGGMGAIFGQADQTRAWRWHGCVCHRDPEARVRHRRIDDNIVSEPTKDRCIGQTYHLKTEACDSWSGEKPTNCSVGAMGWLRTCRQAYIEGIDILYGTNRFHFSGTALVQNLGRVFRAEHLALIKSAEMIWKLGQVARPPRADMDLSSDKRFSGWYTFASLLEVAPEALPNLRYLHITLSGTWYPEQMAPNDILRRSAGDVLEPVDQMVKNYFSKNSHLKEVNVGLPYKIWLVREKHDTRISSRVEKSRSFKDVSDRIWRSLGHSEESLGQEPVEIGYWTRMARNEGRVWALGRFSFDQSG